MRPRTVLTTLTVGVVVAAGSATVAAAAADGSSAGTHHGMEVQDLATMHEEMARTHPGVAGHLSDHGEGPDQMHGGTFEDASHEQMHRSVHRDGAAGGGMHDPSAEMWHDRSRGGQD